MITNSARVLFLAQEMQEDVERLRKIAHRILTKLETEENPNKARILISNVTKLLRLSHDTGLRLVDLQGKHSGALFMDFFTHQRIRRSDMWREYVSFCQHGKLAQWPKGEFFQFVEDSGYSVKKIDGEWLFVPSIKLLPDSRRS